MTATMEAIVMTALPEWLESRPDGLTAEEYVALPEEVCRRIEVVDGAVVLNASPRREHQIVIYELAHYLRRAARPGFEVSIDADLRLRDVPLLNRRPDIVVYDATLDADALLRPEHCLLAVEVMSPTSISRDQIDKPAEYATAGIPHFWRVEMTDGLAVYRYKLDPTSRAYVLLGRDTEELAIGDPFELKLNIAELLA